MKLAKQETEKKPAAKKKLSQSAGVPFNLRAAVLGAIGVVCVLVVCIIIAVEQLYEPPLITIGDDNYTLTDMRYSIFEHELFGYQNETTYQNYFNSSYLDQVVDEESGETNLDRLKTQTKEDFIEQEILYKEAVKAGYTVSDEDKSTADTSISSLKENFDSSILRENGFTNSYLKKAIQKQQLTARFRQDTIDGFDIDDEAITAGIDYEDYHQYQIGVFQVKRTKEAESENAEEETTEEPLSEEEQKEAYDRLEALKDAVASAEDLGSVLEEGETSITYAANTITGEDTSYGKKNVKKIIKMKNGEVSDILKTKNAYYLIKMVDNKVTESYDSAVSSAISTEEDSKFEEYLEEVKKGYTVKENKEKWEDLNFGYITINAYNV